jgi:hypothetical protein
MEPLRIADHDDIANMRLRQLSDNAEAAHDALLRAITNNYPLPMMCALRDARYTAQEALLSEQRKQAAPRTPPGRIPAPTVAQVDRQRLANRLRPLFAPDASHFPPSAVSFL